MTLLFVLFVVFLLDVMALLLRIIATAVTCALDTRNRRVAYFLFFLAFMKEAMAAGDCTSYLNQAQIHEIDPSAVPRGLVSLAQPMGHFPGVYTPNGGNV